MLVSGSQTEDQWVGDLSDPGRGLPGGWTSQCVRLCSRVKTVVLSFLYMSGLRVRGAAYVALWG